jgi:hypothetical protein
MAATSSEPGWKRSVVAVGVVLLQSCARGPGQPAPTPTTNCPNPTNSSSHSGTDVINTPKATPMDREQQFISALRELENKQQPDEDAFVAREVAESRLTGRVAARMWSKAEPQLAHQAFSFLVEIEDLAIVPVLEDPLRDDPTALSQAMGLLTNEEIKLRTRIVKRLDAWLDDKRPIPQKPSLLPTEGKLRPRRVCDEAYVYMRRLVHFGEGELRQLVDRDRFYDLGEEKRDLAIKTARATNSWQVVVDPEHFDDDAPPSSRPPRLKMK